MIDAARRRPAPPNLAFEVGDLRAYRPGSDDVVVTNAALQWVPGHQDLVAAWARALPAGGWLALQVPGKGLESASKAMAQAKSEDTKLK